MVKRENVRVGLVVFDPVIKDYARVTGISGDDAMLQCYEATALRQIPITEVMTYDPARVTPPTEEEMASWMFDTAHARARCPYECEVEPDGTCPHGFKSWMVHMGMV